MKEYLVKTDYGQYNNIWIVLAKDAKDAINQVWEYYYDDMNMDILVENKKVGYEMYKLMSKSELSAKSLGSLHSKNGIVISIN